jgi:hypothetical protein
MSFSRRNVVETTRSACCAMPDSVCGPPVVNTVRIATILLVTVRPATAEFPATDPPAEAHVSCRQQSPKVGRTTGPTRPRGHS